MTTINGTHANGGGPLDFQAANKDLDYDVLIVGGGLSGIFSLYRVRELGLRVKVLEAGSAEGGTWFWCVIASTSCRSGLEVY